MRNLNWHHYYQLAFIVINRSVTKTQFVTFFQLNSYDLRKVQKQLNALQENFGIKLIWQNKISYQITSPKLFSQKFSYLNDYYHRMRRLNSNDDQLLLRCQLALMLLDSPSPISAEQMSLAFGYSRSNMRYHLSWLRQFLSSYQLTVNTKKTGGWKVTGNELHIRQCFMALYSIADPQLMSGPESDPIFQHPENRHQLAEELKIFFARFNITALNFQQLARYLIIGRQRYLASQTVKQLPTKEANLIQAISTPALLSLSSQLQQHFFPAISADEKEKEALTAILLSVDNETADVHLMTEAVCKDLPNQLYDTFQNWFSKDYGIICHQKQLVQLIILACQKLALADYLNTLSQKLPQIEDEAISYHDYPLLSFLTACAAKQLKPLLNPNTDPDVFSLLTPSLFYLLLLLPLKYKPLKVGLVTKAGSEKAELFRQYFIQTVNKNYYQLVEVIDPFQIDRNGGYHYDLIISETNLTGPQQPVIQTDDHHIDLLDLNHLLRMHRMLCEPYLQLVMAKNRSLLPTDILTSDSWETESGHVLFIIVPAPVQTTGCLYLGPQPKHPQNFYVALYAHFSRDNLTFFNLLLHQLAVNTDFRNRLYQHPSLQLINDEINSVSP